MMLAPPMMTASPNDAWLRHILWQTSHHCDQREQHHIIEGVSCITFGISYENMNFKGCDTFTLFDHFYSNIVNEIESTYTLLNGSFRIYDVGADTDGYIEFIMKNGRLFVKGQLGASFFSHSLIFEFEADQTLVGNLLQEITS